MQNPVKQKEQILSSDMARSAVDEAMKNIMLPQIEKEKLVEQLQGGVRIALPLLLY